MTARDLKRWRSRLDLSMRKACEALGCSRSAYMRWESGEQGIPKYIGLACSAIELGIANGGAVLPRETDHDT
jgi:transcriptional regulator with XRE-family HTH domain